MENTDARVSFEQNVFSYKKTASQGFPVKSANFFRNAFIQNTCERLLLVNI